MKQNQYAPMSVAEQAAVIYASNEGYLADVPVNKVGAFEAGLLRYYVTNMVILWQTLITLPTIMMISQTNSNQRLKTITKSFFLRFSEILELHCHRTNEQRGYDYFVHFSKFVHVISMGVD